MTTSSSMPDKDKTSRRSVADSIEDKASATSSASARYLSTERKISTRMPAGGKSAKDMTADRQAMGLSAMRPSEMIVGLDQVAKRAANLEAREIAKKKAGGGITANTAIFVDNTSHRWTWKVRLGLAGAALAALALIFALYHFANRPKISPREGNQRTSRDLIDLKMTIAPRMKLFDEDETITVEAAKQRLSQTIDNELAAISEQIKKDADNHRPLEMQIVQQREWLRKIRELKDAWGQDFIFKLLDANTLEISAIGKKSSNSNAPMSVTVVLRAKKKSVK